MREIKFRAWDKHTKVMHCDKSMQGLWKWIQGCEFPFLPQDKSVPDSMLPGIFANNDFILMQFTGLHDRNGKEIWEGDIVRMLETDWPSKPDNDSRSLEEYLISLTEKWEVIFHKSAAGFYLKRQTGSYNPWTTDDEGFTYQDITGGRHGWIEVIGNVYENPELLEATE